MNLNPAPELAPQLKQLRLSGIFDSLEARNRQAIEAKIAYTDFLALLISDEVARREQKKFSTRLRRAQFRTTKTLEQFDFERLPQLNQALVHDLATLVRVPLLIIDDFGLKPLRAPADEDLHDLIAERYEQVATIVTSNLDFPEWDQAFPANRLLASASLDRLRHNADCLVLDGQSYRAPKHLPGTPKSIPPKAAKSTLA